MTTFEVVAGLVPTALGIAISPISIVELIMAVFSKRARVNGIVFVLVVAIPCFLIPVLGATVVRDATASADSGGSSVGGWIMLVLGVLMLALAGMNLKQYSNTQAPAVLSKIEGMGPGAIAFLAIGVTLFNPKNLAMLLSAGDTMRNAALTGSQVVIASAAFAVVACSPFIAVVGYQLFGGANAQARLDSMKAWLLSNNHKIMFWITAVLGIVFTARGVAALMG